MLIMRFFWDHLRIVYCCGVPMDIDFHFFKLESEKLYHRTLKRQMNRPSTKDRRNLNPAEFIGKDFPSPYPSWDSVEI